MGFEYSEQAYADDEQTNEELTRFENPFDLVSRWYLHDFHGHGHPVIAVRQAKLAHPYGDVPTLEGHGLELAFGYGESMFWLLSRYPNITLDGCDFCRTHDKLIPLFKGLFGTRVGDLWIGDAADVPKHDETYDFINCASFFEHLPDDVYWAVARESFRLLKPGGRLFVWVDTDVGGQHIRVVPPDQTRREMESLGFIAESDYRFRKPENPHTTTERRLVCTRADENIRDMTDITFPSIRAYAKRCGADFRVLDGESPCRVGDGRWHYRIMAIRSLLNDYDRVLHLDADMLVKADCPNLFDVVPPDKIGSVYEDVGSRRENRRELIDCVQEVFGPVDHWHEGYINTGCLLVSKQHANIFRGMPAGMNGVDTRRMPTDLEPGHVIESTQDGWVWCGHGWDDVHLGYMIRKRGHTVHELSPTFNWMSMFSEAWNGAHSRLDAHIVHYAGHANFGCVAYADLKDMTRLDLIRQDAKRFGLLPETAPAVATNRPERVCVVGVFDQPTSTNVPMAAMLEAQGHPVQCLDYRKVIRERGIEILHRKLADVQADVTVVCKGAGAGLPTINPDVFRDMNGTVVYWLPDSVDVAGTWLLTLAEACDVRCATSLVSCEAMRAAGMGTVNQIFEGYDPGLWRPLGVERRYDVSFKAATMDAERTRIVWLMQEAGLTFPPDAGWLQNDAMNVMYNECRVALNPVWGEIFSQRVIHALGAGAFVLSGDCRDLRAAFAVGDHLDTFTTREDAVERAIRWVADVDRRETIAKAGHAAVARYTWHNQMDKLRRAWRGETVADGAFGRDD